MQWLAQSFTLLCAQVSERPKQHLELTQPHTTSNDSQRPLELRYDTIQYIYVRSKADEMASLI